MTHRAVWPTLVALAWEYEIPTCCLLTTGPYPSSVIQMPWNQMWSFRYTVSYSTIIPFSYANKHKALKPDAWLLTDDRNEQLLWKISPQIHYFDRTFFVRFLNDKQTNVSTFHCWASTVISNPIMLNQPGGSTARLLNLDAGLMDEICSLWLIIIKFCSNGRIASQVHSGWCYTPRSPAGLHFCCLKVNVAPK